VQINEYNDTRQKERKNRERKSFWKWKMIAIKTIDPFDSNSQFFGIWILAYFYLIMVFQNCGINWHKTNFSVIDIVNNS